MIPRVLRKVPLLVLLLLQAGSLPLSATAYEGRPRLVVLFIVDHARHDLLLRQKPHFGTQGFRTFFDRGAVFSNCRYDYFNLKTAPGNATIATGAYSNGHGIPGNEWWDPAKQKLVSSVEDPRHPIVGVPATSHPGASPLNLLAGTFADELRLATDGASRTFGVALKDRSAILPVGYSASGAYWIDAPSGLWVTSSYYGKELPPWVRAFNEAGRAEKYWDLEWKSADGAVLRHTRRGKTATGQPEDFYTVIGRTPFAHEYTFEFARELVTEEKLGQGPATDLLVVGISGTDILGHLVGPNDPQYAEMLRALDRQMGEFIGFLGRQLGLANVWLALSADHGTAPLPSFAQTLRIPAANFSSPEVRKNLNQAIARLVGGSGTPRSGEYIRAIVWPYIYLATEAFAATGLSREDAERLAAQAVATLPMAVSAYTRTTLERGPWPPNERGRILANSVSPYGGSYVVAVQRAFTNSGTRGNHQTPYSYDAYVPLAFYGVPFQPGTYRGRCEVTDLAPTLSSLLGIVPPSHSVGRVLTEALAPAEAKQP